MNKRSNLLDIIKGVMIVFIIITHYRFVYPDDYQKYGFFFYIDMAVPVFMIITGYLYAKQFDNKGIDTIEKAYSAEYIIPKLLRFIIPFGIIFSVETLWLIVKKYGIIDIIQLLAQGGVGPGSYYTPIMLQTIFVIPIVFFCVKRYDFFGTLLCLIVTAMWELIQFSWGMDGVSYKTLIFRYISIIAFGCYIAIGKKALNKAVLLSMFIIGIVWQILLNYTSLHPIFMNYDWARVNYLSCLFVMPVMYALIKRFSDSSIHNILLQQFGKASYNIYLVQMAFYGCGPANIIYRYVPRKWLGLLMCLTVNLIGGYIFYCFENKITSKIVNKVKNHNYFSEVVQIISNRCNSFVGKV